VSVEFLRNILHELREKFSKVTSLDEISQIAASFIGETFGCSTTRVTIILSPSLRGRDGFDSNSTAIEQENTDQTRQSYSGVWERNKEIGRGAGKPLFNDSDLSSLPTLFISDVRRSAIAAELLERLTQDGVLSAAVIPIFSERQIIGWIELRYREKYYRFRRDDSLTLEQIAEYIGLFVERYTASTTRAPVQREFELRYKRLAEYGNIVIIRTDATYQVVEVLGNIERLLGVTSGEMMKSPKVWESLIFPADLRRLTLKILRLKDRRIAVSEEVRVVNRQSSSVKWLLLKAVPIYDQSNRFSGWEGFGIDITDKREAEDQLMIERRRLEALYELSRTLQLNLDPAIVTLKALNSLISATSSDAGFGALLDSTNQRLEIVATEGLSEEFIAEANAQINRRGLVRVAVEQREAMLIPDIQEEPRAAKEAVKREGLRSAMIVPFTFEGEVLGVLVIYRKRAAKFSAIDFEMVSAAANQIGLSARQAEIYGQEKHQAAVISSLYNLIHEVSKHYSPKEVASRALAILQREIPCKRMWLGLMNEQGSHVVGQAGFGPGVTSQLINIQIELALRHDFFDQAIKTRAPIVVEEGSSMECSGLNRIMQRLKPGLFIVVPLLSAARVVGILVAEPILPSAFLAQKKIPLIARMGNEIASVVLARRFEARMAEANKMRMAGLLAAGVAHNFNNLMMAILGQIDLLKSKLPESQALNSSTRMIVEAVKKGSVLTKQLLAFSATSPEQPKIVSINDILNESKDIYPSVLGSNINFQLVLEPEAPLVRCDASQIQQVVTNLLVNAKDALAEKSEGSEVILRTATVNLRSGEIDPELSPGQYLRIDIEDNGIGMEADKLARCFEPFFTTKNADNESGVGIGGTGLGLSSAYAILRNHGGLITVSSEFREGSTFSLYLPAIQESVSKSALESQTTSEQISGAANQPEASESINVTEKIDETKSVIVPNNKPTYNIH
jgi:PAS domain S-box-containing protein